MNKQYLIQFIEEKNNGNKKEFTDQAGITYSSLINFLNSDKKDISLSTTTLKKIVHLYPDFNFRLFINEGDDTDYMDSSRSNILLPEPLRANGIPFVPVKARAGYLHGFGDEVFLDSLQKVVLPNFNGEHTNKRIFQVEGDSMYKTLCNDDLVIAEQVEPNDPIRDNYVYVVVSRTEGIVIKRVSDRVKERKALVLHSDNFKAGYSPIVIPTSEVQELWLAKGKISYDLSRDHTLENEMTEVKNELAVLRSEIHKLL